MSAPTDHRTVRVEEPARELGSSEQPLARAKERSPPHHLGAARTVSLKAMEQVVDLVRTESSNEVLVELSHGRSPAGYREDWDINPEAVASAAASGLMSQSSR